MADTQKTADLITELRDDWQNDDSDYHARLSKRAHDALTALTVERDNLLTTTREDNVYIDRLEATITAAQNQLAVEGHRDLDGNAYVEHEPLFAILSTALPTTGSTE